MPVAERLLMASSKRAWIYAGLNSAGAPRIRTGIGLKGS